MSLVQHGAGGSSVSLTCPMLTPTNYTVWAIKVEAILDAQGVWEAVSPADGATVDEKKNKMARAQLLGELSEDILMQVSTKKTAKEVWDSLKTRFIGADRVKAARLSTLRGEFERLCMGDEEQLDDYAGKISGMAVRSMDVEGTCPVCHQLSNICTRARRNGEEFAVKMVNQHFKAGIGTPCCFTATLRRLCPKFWLVAKGKRTIGGDLNMQTKHHIFLDENRHNFELCGPYWRSLVEAFCVEFGDTVIFTLQKDEYEDNKWFNIRVISEDNLVCEDLPDSYEDALKNAFFTDIYDVSQEEMNWVVQGMEQLTKDLNFDDEVPKFYIHRLDPDDNYRLDIDVDVFYFRHDVPIRGQVMYSLGNKTRQGTYKGKRGEFIRFKGGWSDFRAEVDLREGDLVIASVEIKHGEFGVMTEDASNMLTNQCIVLNFYKIDTDD